MAVVVHNGVPHPDPERLARLRVDRPAALGRLSVPPGRVLIGMVGRLSPEKRGDLRLITAPLDRSRRPGTR